MTIRPTHLPWSPTKIGCRLPITSVLIYLNFRIDSVWTLTELCNDKKVISFDEFTAA